MKMKALTLLATVLVLAGCAPSIYIARYNIELSSVESPTDASVEFGKTQTTNYDEASNRYCYSDEYIDIYWYVTAKEFQFELKNKTRHPMKLNWDDMTYTNIKGRAGRVVHKQTKYVDITRTQAPITLPRESTISDVLVPAESIVWEEKNGYTTQHLLPTVYKDEEDFKIHKGDYLGAKMGILFPIEIEGKTNNYFFEFTVKSLIN